MANKKWEKLIKMVKALNKAELTDEAVDTDADSYEELMSDFCDAIEEIDDNDKADEIPKAVADFYENLDSDADSDDDDGDDGDTDEGKPKKEKGKGKAKKGKGKKGKAKKEKKEKAKKGKAKKEKAKKGKAKKEKKEKAKKGKAKKEKPKKEKPKKEKKEVAKSEYDHREGSMGAVIDGLLTKGCTRGKMVSTIVDKFDKEENAAVAKVNAHLKHLENNHSVKIKVKENKDPMKEKLSV